MKKSSIFLVSVLLLLAFLHIIGLHFYLYWRLPAYDSLVHFVGGFWFACFYLLWITPKNSSWLTLWITGILAGLVAGIVWELFELGSTITVFSDSGYALNTASDIFFDIVGGVIGTWYVLRGSQSQSEQNLSL